MLLPCAASFFAFARATAAAIAAFFGSAAEDVVAFELSIEPSVTDASDSLADTAANFFAFARAIAAAT